MRSIWALATIAFALAASPCAAQTEPLSDEEQALYTAVAAQLRAQPDGIANAPHRRFHKVAIEHIFYPRDQAGIFDSPEYDDRASTRYDAAAIERWYISQVPSNAAFVRRDAQAEILYLPPCRAPDLYDLTLDVGDDGTGEIDEAIVERMWIYIALTRLGLDDVDIPEFHLRSRDSTRGMPDPGILELNRRIAELIAEQADAPTAPGESGRLVLVLEGYCGPRTAPLELPNLIPEPIYPMSPPPPPVEQPRYYQLQLPTNVTSGVSAGLLWAEACRIRTGSRTNTSCPRWSPVADGVPLQGRGKYRLVATLNGQPRSFRYTVLPMHLGNGDAPPVPVIPEP